MGKPRPTIFAYKMIGGRLSPMISAGIRLEGVWYPIEMYVDSGAAYTILRAKVATDVGFDYESGTKINVQVGDGSMIPIFLHRLSLQIGNTHRVATIGFSAKLGVPFNLLGRVGVFEHFR